MSLRVVVTLGDPNRGGGVTTGFDRFADALRYAQDETSRALPCRITRTSNGALLAERRVDGRWYNADGVFLPSPR